MAGEDQRRTPPLRAFLTGQPFTPVQGPPAPEPPPPPPTWLDRVFDVARGATVGTDWSRPAREESGAALAAELLAASVPIVAGVRKGVQGIRAYHGSPHDFDVFDFSKVGTGQGAATYGHGLYFAEAEPVARGYRQELSTPTVSIGGQAQEIPTWSGNMSPQPRLIRRLADARRLHQADAPDRDIINSVYESLRQELRNPNIVGSDEARNHVLRQLEILEAAEARGLTTSPGGRVYEVNLRVTPEELLDWNRALAEQPHVQEALRRLGLQDIHAGEAFGFPLRDPRKWLEIPTDTPGSGVYRRLTGLYRRPSAFPEITIADEAATSTALREAGVPGLRYLDQVSRGQRAQAEIQAQLDAARQQLAALTGPPRRGVTPLAPEQRAAWDPDALARRIASLEAELATSPTRNIVMFDDRLIDILRKYGLLLPAAGLGAAAARDSLGTPPPVLAPPPTR